MLEKFSRKKGQKVEKIRIAIAGNPNSGKTSIFNNLTGSHQHVGNWPGVTVEKKEGYFTHKGFEVEVIDLPGIYSLSASTIDEKIARDFLLEEKPDVVICVIDSSNLERNLYLTLELLEMGVNIVSALNMTDVTEMEGLEIDDRKLSLTFNHPVVKTVATKNRGTEALKDAIIYAYESSKIRTECDSSCPFYNSCPFRRSCPYIAFRGSNVQDSQDALVKYDRTIEEAIKELVNLLKKYDLDGNLRWFAVKLLEGDQYIMHLVKQKYEIKEIEERVLALGSEIENNLDDDIVTLLISGRYSYIKGLIGECVKRKGKRRAADKLSAKIDRIIISRTLGIPIFLAIMYLTFKLVFTVGTPFADLIDMGFGHLGEITANSLSSLGASSEIISFFVDGIIGGVGSVLVFLPNILLLFFAISILEDTGYMARAAFVMDKLMHSFGLHGKSFIPMILGFGCNVPAILATRTLESRKDRILTILIIPLMSCSARLPIYILFASVFFPHHKGLTVFSLYLLGIILAILVAKLFKGLFFKEEFAPLIMEIPPYRLPQWKSALLQMWIRSRLFLTKAGTIIFAAVILVWILSSLPPGVAYASEKSLIGHLGKFIAPIMKPAGFGFWQATVALIFGILAKEVVIGTLGTLFGGKESLATVLPNYFTPLSAYAFMIMSLIYIPCIATVATIKRETDWKWTILAVGYSLILGWVLAVLVYQIGMLQ